MSTTPQLGIIEGYFGTPWRWADRTHAMRTLAGYGYRFFIYAPKADVHLRRRWKEPHPKATHEALATFATACRAAGVRFGVGFSPFEVYRHFDDAARATLRARIAELDSLGLDDLAILFDDMRGDIPDLASRQAAIIAFVASCTKATRLIMCPSYYTDDAVLDRVFGARPANYLEDLGRLLDPKVEVFWTGEEVCARAFSPGHLADVAGKLRRKPFLWDNYPVNDGPRMSQLSACACFTGRPAIDGGACRRACHQPRAAAAFEFDPGVDAGRQLRPWRPLPLHVVVPYGGVRGDGRGGGADAGGRSVVASRRRAR